MKRKYFGLESIYVDQLSRLKWIVEEFLTTDLQALPHIQRNAFIEKFFRYLFEKELKELTTKDAKQYERYLNRREEKQ